MSSRHLLLQLSCSPALCTGLKRSTPAIRFNSTKAAPKENLTWPEYLSVKKSKRKWQIFFTFPCALLGLAGGISYFGTRHTDPTQLIMGLDPFMFYGMSTMGCAIVGAGLGPTIGSALWRLTHKQKLHLIDAKDQEFFRRIAKNRVDAELITTTNPVPDYYGERIGSLYEYRQWLRDQNKYRRKAVLPEKLD